MAVDAARGHLQHHLLRGQPVLADEEDVAAVQEGNNGDDVAVLESVAGQIGLSLENPSQKP